MLPQMTPVSQILARYISGAAMLALLVSLGTVMLVIGEPNKALAQGTVTYQFCVWDTAAEDGDKINLDIDNRRILTDHELKNQEHCEHVQVTLRQATNVMVTTTDDGNPYNSSAIRIKSNDGQPVLDGDGNEVEGDWQLCTASNSSHPNCAGLNESQEWTLWPISENTVLFQRPEDPPEFTVGNVSSGNYVANEAIAELVLPEAVGGAPPLTYSLDPALPPGLTFDSRTRALSGTPVAASPARTYAYTATDAEGRSASLSFTIEVDEAPGGVELSEDTLTVVEGREGIYSVSLRSGPDEGGTVVVQPRSANPHIRFNPGSLTFDSENWAEPQSIAFAVGEENQDVSLTINHVIDGFGDTRDGDVIEGGTVTVSLIPSAAPEPEEKQAVQETVAGVAAATVSNVTSNIGARFSAPSAPTGGVSVSLAGTPLSFGQAGPKFGGRGERASSASGFDVVGEEGWQWRHQMMSTDALLRTSSFEIALGAAESDKGSSPGIASRITMWGRGDLQFFESGGGARSGYDGDLAAGYLGADVAMEGGWLAGVAVSRIAAEADYTLGGAAGGGGTLEAELTNVHPYIRAALNDRSEAWAILGVGAGELTDTAKGTAQTAGVESKSDMTMRMLSAGARHQLATDTGIDWAVLGDGSFASVETEDGTEAVDGITADVWRARLGVEASWTTVSASGSSFTSFLEVAGRQDGGDGATGLGLELSPGVSFSDPASGLSLEARGRALAVHSADNHREYGVSLTASVTPGADGRGLSLAIAPVWGTPEGALDEADRSLFFGDAGDSHRDDTLSLNSRIAWGFSAGHGVMAPFAALSLHDGYGHRLRLGSRYSLGSALDLELSGEGSGGSSGGSTHSVQVSGRLRF